MVKPLVGCFLLSMVLVSCDDTQNSQPDLSTSDQVVSESASTTTESMSEEASTQSGVVQLSSTVEGNSEGTIAYIPSIGSSFSYRISMSMNAVSDQLSSNQSTNYYYTKRVLSRKDDITTFAFIYDSIDMIREVIPRVNVPEGGPQILKFSTTDPSLRSLPQFQQYVRITEEEVTMTVNSKGEILDVSGVEGIVDSLFGDRLAQVPKEEIPALYKSFAWEAYIMPLQQEFVSYPTSKVEQGSTWNKEYSTKLSLVFPADLRITYTLNSIEDNKALLSASLALVDVQDTIKDGPQSAVLVSSKVEGSGTTELDLVHGYTVRKLHSGVTTSVSKMIGLQGNGSEQRVENTLETTQEVQLLNVVHGK